MGWGIRFAGVLVGGAVLAGGSACSNAGPPGQALPAYSADPVAAASADPSASAQASTVPSESPSPGSEFTDDAMPALARVESHNGVQAFARYWIEVANHSLGSGDVSDLRLLSTAKCKTCTGLIEDIEKIYGDGGSIEGGQLTVLRSSAARLQSDAVPYAVVEASATREVHRDAEGNVLGEGKVERLRFVFSLQWVDGAWLITEIQRGVGDE